MLEPFQLWFHLLRKELFEHGQGSDDRTCDGLRWTGVTWGECQFRKRSPQAAGTSGRGCAPGSTDVLPLLCYVAVRTWSCSLAVPSGSGGMAGRLGGAGCEPNSFVVRGVQTIDPEGSIAA
jgi:hypothetical protein